MRAPWEPPAADADEAAGGVLLPIGMATPPPKHGLLVRGGRWRRDPAARRREFDVPAVGYSLPRIHDRERCCAGGI